MMLFIGWRRQPGRGRRVLRGLLAVALCALVGFPLYVYVLYAYVWDPKQELCMSHAWDALCAHGGEVGPLVRDRVAPTGEAFLSWRRICADGDSGPRLGDPDEPWNASSNRAAARGGSLTFCFSPPPWIIEKLFPSCGRSQTKVLAITGPDTAFDPCRTTSLRDLPPNLILLVEVWGTGINWLQPGDIDVRDYRHLRMDGRDGQGCWVLFADGILAFIKSDVPLENVKRFCTITSAKKSIRLTLLGPWIQKVHDLARDPPRNEFEALIP